MDLKQLQREWVKKAEDTAILQAKMWDGRAEEFDKKPIPQKEEDPFLKYLWEKAQPQKNMRVLDIGCGAGQYSLALAGEVREVIGTDVSSGMIEAAKQRANTAGIYNVHFYLSEWAKTDPDGQGWRENFDLVFAHMTPAICDYHTLDLMDACAGRHCFLVKPVRRHDAILDGAFQEIGLTHHREETDETVLNAFTYLWLKGYTPEIRVREKAWTNQSSVERMREWCVNRAAAYRKLSQQDIDKITEYLVGISRDNEVTETVKTSVVTIYWKK